jgi:hypothetical protein
MWTLPFQEGLVCTLSVPISTHEVKIAQIYEILGIEAIEVTGEVFEPKVSIVWDEEEACFRPPGGIDCQHRQAVA